MVKKTPLFHILVLTAFLANMLGPVPLAHAGEMVLPLMPTPGTRVELSSAFIPAHLKGITIHPDNALQFDFLINKGEGGLDDAQKKEEYSKLVKYFLASLTIPDEDQWVNLSPYEKGRVIQNNFGKTEMGRDLLGQDYFLKQITSSLMYPESDLGKRFWDRVYERAFKEYGTINVPVNTFNKVWIVPDEAIVYESGNTAYILKSHLKVMLEEDYLSLQKHSAIVIASGEAAKQSQDTKAHTVASKVVKEIILPEIEKEVNEGKNFAMLRQIYSGMVLATWYKKALKESLLGKVYANRAKVAGVDVIPAKAGIQEDNIEGIYQKYLAAFKKGVYNYIKEDVDKYSNQVIPRKYFAGGFERGKAPITVVTPESLAMLSSTVKAGLFGILAATQTGIVQGEIDSVTIQATPKAAVVSNSNVIADNQMAVIEGAVSRTLSISNSVMVAVFIKSQNKMLVMPVVVTKDGSWKKAVAQFRIELENRGIARDDVRILTLDAQNFPEVKGEVVYQLRNFPNPQSDGLYTKGGSYKVVITAGKIVVREAVRWGEGSIVRIYSPLNGEFKRLPVDGAMTSSGVQAVLQGARRAVEDLNGDRGKLLSSKMLGEYVTEASEKARGNVIDFIAGFSMNIESLFAQVHGIKIFDKLEGFPLLRNEGNGEFTWKGVVIARQSGNDFVFVKEGAAEYVQKLREHIQQRFGLDSQAMISSGQAQRADDTAMMSGTLSEQYQAALKAYQEYARSTPDLSNQEMGAQVKRLSDRVNLLMLQEYTALRKNNRLDVGQAKEILLSNTEMALSDRLLLRMRKAMIDTLDDSSVAKSLERANIPEFMTGWAPTAAVADKATRVDDVGGIDMNAANLNLQIKRDGKGVPLPIAQQDMKLLNQIEGFVPVIIDIKPITTLPILSELQEKLQTTPASAVATAS